MVIIIIMITIIILSCGQRFVGPFAGVTVIIESVPNRSALLVRNDSF